MALCVKVCQSAGIHLALRAIGSNSKTFNGIDYAIRQHQSGRSFSSVAATSKELIDATLTKVLECEINSAMANLKTSSQVETSKDSVSSKIKVRAGCGSLTLKKDLPTGEHVYVDVDDMEEIASGYDDYYNCEEEEDKDMKAPPAIPMTVVVRKRGKEGDLKFKITFSKEDIVFQSLRINNEYGCRSLLDGREMDYELQRHLSKYFDIRGFTRKIEFLLKSKYVSEKQKEDDLFTLQGLKKRIER